ncbi:MAG: hypothetical protein RLZZ244_1420 [Verrucomicrobiota bacterium]|jgi:hypothetical protein
MEAAIHAEREAWGGEVSFPPGRSRGGMAGGMDRRGRLGGLPGGRLLVGILAVLGLAGGTSWADAGREHVIISGGVSLFKWEQYRPDPHDKWWMNFVRAARIRIAQIRERDAGAMITWFVYKPAYERRASQEAKDLLKIIDSVRDAYGVRRIYFSETSELLRYLNEGQDRERVKIGNFEYFGHSNKACWMFDYSNYVDGASKAWLHENELSQLRPGIFAKDAFAKSWGCYSGESMIGHFRRATGVRMWGMVGKTQYQTDELPKAASFWGRWKH